MTTDSRPPARLVGLLPGALLDAWAVVMPTDCSGCGAADRALCGPCRAALTPNPVATTREDLSIWSALEYGGVTSRVLGAFKDGGRTDAAGPLAAALRAAIGAALIDRPEARPGSVVLATVPSSRLAWRLRGFHPVDLLVRRAGFTPTRLLAARRTAADQVGLGRQARIDNRRDSLRATRPLDGWSILLVDDIVTTGSTLLEARRAIQAAGGQVAGLATVAHTPRHHPDSSRSRQTA
jgi:predicted amidophosphoribosyltransferase